MKFASLFIKPNGLVVYSNSQTKAGFWIASEPYFHIPSVLQIEDVMIGIKNALKESQMDVEIPARGNDFQKNHLQKLKVKSIKQLQNTAKYMEIFEENGMLRFIPTINLHSKEGHIRIEDQNLFISADSPIEDMIPVLVQAIKLCE